MSEKELLDEKILKAKREFKPVLKNTVNPFLKNKYADLSTVVDAIEDALSKNGLDYYQSIEGNATMTIIPGAKPGEDTVLVSGQSVVTVITDGISQRKTTYPFVVRLDKNKPEQSLGAAHTYDRRHGLLAAFGLRAEDTDGEGAGAKSGKAGQYSNSKPTAVASKPAQPSNPNITGGGSPDAIDIDFLKNLPGVKVEVNDAGDVFVSNAYSYTATLKNLKFEFGKDSAHPKAWVKKAVVPMVAKAA